MSASDTIEARGHLIDSGLLSAIFDKIIEHKAAYEILKFDIGRTNDDASSIEMRITAGEQAVLDDLLQQLTTFGCHPVRERNASVKPAERDRLLRRQFDCEAHHLWQASSLEMQAWPQRCPFLPMTSSAVSTNRSELSYAEATVSNSHARERPG